ncbi:MAG: rhomboid family intramembrane serine protease [Methanolobus sp.]|uniref:rhomboid family intramembrane serine protease n=1 Tax=Methanolobus sp. TaxID=1874737 RepID=UPI00273165A4|nr:rhomboid family intramembrane serine protease [Methanolobus sp.]MDP2218210.1 rhomboid family intramembrane serine protease [Methanolobus sp.]
MKTLDKKCWICGREEHLPFKCRFCGNVFCSQHRLPEQHACAGLEKVKQHSADGSNRANRQSGTDDIMKDVLKSTAKYAAKSAFRGIRNNVSYSMRSSPSMAIIYLCLFSFLLQMVLDPMGINYAQFFMFVPINFLAQPWTLITHMFLHNGFFHLFFNMMVLFFFGPELERRAGKATFLRVYFIAGVVAVLGYSLTTSQPHIGVVGASGAIMGVFAALAVIAPEIRVYVYFIPMRIVHALILFALVDFLLIGSNDMVAHTAHLTGILVGLLMGLRIKKSQQRSGWHDPYRY